MSELVERLKRFAQNPRKRRRGYRLAHAELKRDLIRVGKLVNHKRVYRLWRKEGLCIPLRRCRKRLRGKAPARELTAAKPDAVWCFDFIEEKTIHGQKLRIFCVSDEFTRESLAVAVGTSFVSERVCQTLESLIEERAVPDAFRMDNGPEFIALALRGLCHRRGIDPAYIDPGKPWQNGFAESFHARLRDEFMDAEVFYGVRDAQVRLSGWRRYFNEERLHSSLGYRTPWKFAASLRTLEASQTRAGSAVAAVALSATAAAGVAEGVAGTEEAGGT